MTVIRRKTFRRVLRGSNCRKGWPGTDMYITVNWHSRIRRNRNSDSDADTRSRRSGSAADVTRTADFPAPCLSPFLQIQAHSHCCRGLCWPLMRNNTIWLPASPWEHRSRRSRLPDSSRYLYNCALPAPHWTRPPSAGHAAVRSTAATD